MVQIDSLNRIRSLFRQLKASNTAKHLINDKLTDEQRDRFYEMDEFFRLLSEEDFNFMEDKPFNGINAYAYFCNNLKSFLDKDQSNNTKGNIVDLFNDICKSFELLFPETRYSEVRHKAKLNAQQRKLTLHMPAEDDTYHHGDNASTLYNTIKFLGKEKDIDVIYGLLLKVENNKEKLAELLDDITYTSKRLSEGKRKLNDAEEEFEQKTKEIHANLVTNSDAIYKKFEEQFKENFEGLNRKIDAEKTKYTNSVLDFNKKVKELNKRFDALEIGTYREELARYFLREHDKLKGKIDSLAALYFVFLNAGVAVATYLVTSLGCKFTTVNAVLSGFAAIIICSFIIFHWDTKKVNARVFKSMEGLLTPYWCWLFLTFVGMSSILYKAISVSTGNDSSNTISGSSILGLIVPHIGVYIILVWFTWFSAKQFSYTKQIADEYEYKYALAKAYMSYKDEALSVVIEHNNNPYLVALLDSVIKNIANSPVQCVKQDVHTPFSEVLKAAKEIIHKQE